MKGRRFFSLLVCNRENFPDAIRAALSFFLAALLGLMAPVATLLLFDWVVPQTDFSVLGWLLAGLLRAAVGSGALELVAGRSWLRLADRMALRWEPEVWLRLTSRSLRWLIKVGPVKAGSAAQSVHEMTRRMIEWGPRFQSAVAVAVVNVGFLFFIDRFLAVVGLLCAIGALVILLGLNLRRTRALKVEYGHAEGLHSEALEWLQGWDVLRMAGAFRDIRRKAGQSLRDRLSARQQSGGGEGWKSALFAGVAAIPCLILFAAVDGTDLDIGSFLAFLVAFGTLVGSLRIMADCWPVIAEMRSLEGRVESIWEVAGPVVEDKLDPGELQGAISVERLRFGYDSAREPLLSDVSFAVAPGECLGLTGPSGCGKPTVLRLLAGLESPEAGCIRFDQWDLRDLDLDKFRRQIGVVWQRGAWYPGDLLRNIIGESELSMGDAWYAAELAGLADAIRALPMQMHTMVAEAAANFSASERQRILIARALARRPRIIFLDEATSALDRISQARLMETLAGLVITRVMVALPEDRIRHADRIVRLGG